jgi:hypothetical protein
VIHKGGITRKRDTLALALTCKKWNSLLKDFQGNFFLQIRKKLFEKKAKNLEIFEEDFP